MSFPLLGSHRADEKHNNLNILRLLLAIFVIFSHSFLLSPVPTDSPLMWATHRQAYEGELAVNGFFVLSGFLITMSWLRNPQLGEFLKRRFLRIYPGFLVAFAVSVMIVGALGSVSAEQYFHALPAAHLLRQWLTLGKLDGLPTFLSQKELGQVNGSLWTIRIEFECYLLIPLLAWSGLLKRRVLITLLTVLAVSLHILLPFVSHTGIHLPDFVIYQGRFVAYFLIGMVAFLYRDKITYSNLGAIIAAAALVLAGFFGGFQAVLPFAWTYLLLYAGFHPRLPFQHFGRNADISYGMYLYGWPAKRLVLLIFPAIAPYSLFALALLLTIPLAFLSWYCIEKPSLQRKGKVSSKDAKDSVHSPSGAMQPVASV